MVTKRRTLSPSQAARDFICRAKSRPTNQNFFCRRTRFEPISAVRNPLMTGRGFGDDNTHFRKLMASLGGEQLPVSNFSPPLESSDLIRSSSAPMVVVGRVDHCGQC